MGLLRRKIDWVIAEEYAPSHVARVALRNRNGSDRQSILRGCRPGMRVTFLHDPEHREDPSAVAVLVAGGQQIGNLDPALSPEIAPLLAAEDVRFVATIHHVGPWQDEEGRKLVGAQIAIVREELREIEGFSPIRGVSRVARWVDKKLVALTKGDRFFLGLARAIALFLAGFTALVVVMTIVSILTGLVSRG